MSPCRPGDVSINIPDGPSGPAIPGFGVPFSIDLPDINPFPDGFPENLLDLLDKLKMLVPSGILKPQLSLNFAKDAFDAIMKLVDQFMPFLMLYKFFLPILELIICIIEVLCSISNPFKLIRAMNRLFTQCIPNFLNLFPIFALIIMIISLLLLLLALIEYIISEILKFIETILRNILALYNAITEANAAAIKAIAMKIGAMLCVFQNLFVLFAIFNIIIQIFRDLMSMIFSIPPCEETDPSDEDGCCTPDVCPAIVKQDYTRFTGTFKYLNQVGFQPPGISFPIPSLSGLFTFSLRPESWQFYDENQELAQQFRNIFDAYDVVTTPKPIFFPTDAVYTAQTALKQAPYKIDIRMFYNPADWGREGEARYIRFSDCIVQNVPTTTLNQGDLTTTEIQDGVVSLVGGIGYEDDWVGILYGFAADGITQTSERANLQNFFHMQNINTDHPENYLKIDDGYTFFDVEYVFRPNIAPLLSKNIVTTGCVPSVAVSRAFLNDVYAGDIGLKIAAVKELINRSDFPNPAAAQECLTVATNTLKANLSEEGLAEFQQTALVCINKLKDDTNKALGDLVGIGFDPCKSLMKAEPLKQFTTKPILVTVNLNERNGFSVAEGLSTEASTNVAARIKGHITFGEISNFWYDGYGSFLANITSDTTGDGSLMVSFDDNMLCTNTFPATGAPGDAVPVHSIQSIDYQFIYAPGIKLPGIATGEGDTDGQPRRDASDLAGNISGGST